MTPAVRAVALVVGLGLLAGCGEPRFTLWKLERGSIVPIEAGLDRLMCETLLTKQEQQKEVEAGVYRSLDRDMIRAGGVPTPRTTTLTRFKCVKAGVDPETGEKL